MFNIPLPTKATDFIFLICSRFKHKQQELRITHQIMHDVLNQKDDFLLYN